jgi:hypothetical protein
MATSCKLLEQLVLSLLSQQPCNKLSRWANFPRQVYFLVCTDNKCPWQVYLLVCTVNKCPLTSLSSRMYSQQVFLDKFTFSCVQSTSVPWQVYLLVCIQSTSFLDKFTFSCVQSTSFPWQVYFDKFTFSCVLSRVYSEQVFFDKYPLTSLPSRVHGMLLNINLTSRPPNSVCQNHINFSCTPIKLSLAAVHCTNKFSLSKSWHVYTVPLERGFLAKKKCQFLAVYTRENRLVKEKLLFCAGLKCRSIGASVHDGDDNIQLWCEWICSCLENISRITLSCNFAWR